MEKWNCIIVDDEEVDRLMTMSFVKRFPRLNVVGVFESAEEALVESHTLEIDIAFLDIDMPNVSGIEFRKKMNDIPVCVFITGHSEYAVESYDLETLDFIVKPIKFARFEQTMKRIEDFMETKIKAKLFEMSIGGDTIFLKEGYNQTKISLKDVLYLEALKDYTYVVTLEKKHCVWSNLGVLLKKDYFQSFVRIHKSFAVQKQYVSKIFPQEVILNNKMSIPIGRSFKDNLNLLV
jgi:two-component system, LytTR family, response regulator